MNRPALLAFDVNETLLSLDPIKAKFDDVFGVGAPVGEWFTRMLHGSLVANHVDDYRCLARSESKLSLPLPRNAVWPCVGRMPRPSSQP